MLRVNFLWEGEPIHIDALTCSLLFSLFEHRDCRIGVGSGLGYNLAQRTEGIYRDLFADSHTQQFVARHALREKSQTAESSLTIELPEIRVHRHRSMIDTQHFEVLDEHRLEGKPLNSQFDDLFRFGRVCWR